MSSISTSVEKESSCVTIIIGNETQQVIDSNTTEHPREAQDEVNPTATEKRRWRSRDEPDNDVQFRGQQSFNFVPKTTVESFRHYFDDELLEKIRYQAILYSTQKGKSVNITRE
jgi:hypothetical protein